MGMKGRFTGFSAEDELVHGIRTARAAICIAEGDPSTAVDLLQDVLDAPPPAGLPRTGSLRRICTPASRTWTWAIDTPPPARPRRRSRPPSQTD